MTFIYQPVLDSGFLNELYSDDYEYAETVFETFLGEVKVLLQSCTEQMEKGDLPAFQKAIHKIKPTLTYVGLTSISNDLAKIEQQCNFAGAVADLQGAYAGVSSKIQEMIPVIEQEKAKLHAYNNPQ